MSRSNPTQNNPNPAERFFEWEGSNGLVRYYDKELKKNIEIGDEFTFILLDELATIKGWNDESDSGIYSNEIRDTRAEPLVVKAFKAKQPIAEGLYTAIRDRIVAAGGSFTANLYIAFREDKKLRLGSLTIKGVAMNAWVDFRKANSKAAYEKAIQIKGSTAGKKGKIEYKKPNFFIRDLNQQTDEEAKAIDKTLQEYLTGYFARTTTSKATHPDHSEEVYSQEQPEDRNDHISSEVPSGDDVDEQEIPW